MMKKLIVFVLTFVLMTLAYADKPQPNTDTSPPAAGSEHKSKAPNTANTAGDDAADPANDPDPEASLDTDTDAHDAPHS